MFLVVKEQLLHLFFEMVDIMVALDVVHNICIANQTTGAALPANIDLLFLMRHLRFALDDC